MSLVSKTFGKIIGVYQIIGSLIGFYYLIRLTLANSLFDSWLTIVISVPLMAFSAYAGYDAFKNNSFELTLYNQYLQIFQLKLNGFAFYYIAGIYIGAGVIFPRELYFDLSLFESVFFFRINSPGGKNVIGFNLISILLTLLTIYVKRQIRKASE